MSKEGLRNALPPLWDFKVNSLLWEVIRGVKHFYIFFHENHQILRYLFFSRVKQKREEDVLKIHQVSSFHQEGQAGGTRTSKT